MLSSTLKRLLGRPQQPLLSALKSRVLPLRLNVSSTPLSPYAQLLTINNNSLPRSLATLSSATPVSLTRATTPAFSMGFLRVNSGRKRRLQVPFKRWRIVRGDRVVAIRGKDKGKQGTVLKVYRKSNRVLVQGVNLKTKSVKADPQSEEKSGFKQIPHSMHVSAVALIDPESGRPTRVRFAFLEDGQKVRISKRSGAIIEKPVLPDFKKENRIKFKVDGLLDTPPAKVLEVTYLGEDFGKIRAEFEAYIREKERKEKYLVFDE